MRYANRQTETAVAGAQRACSARAWGRAVALLERADGLEAWAGVSAGTGTRQAIADTITAIRARQEAGSGQLREATQ